MSCPELAEQKKKSQKPVVRNTHYFYLHFNFSKLNSIKESKKKIQQSSAQMDFNTK